MNKTEREFSNDHYSDKGGHKARSSFWNSLRKIQQLPQELRWIGRRKMRRIPDDGRR